MNKKYGVFASQNGFFFMNDFWILYLAVYIDDSPIPLALSSFSAASLFGSC